MSSTNKTEYLKLSQFLPTDRPSWEDDYNTDMKNIDDAYGDVSQTVETHDTNIINMQAQIESLEGSVGQVSALQAEVASHQETLEGMATSIENLTTADTNLEADVASLQGDVTKLDSRVAEIESNPDGVSKEYVDTEVGKVNTVATSNKTDITNLTNVVAGLGEELETTNSNAETDVTKAKGIDLKLVDGQLQFTNYDGETVTLPFAEG